MALDRGLRTRLRIPSRTGHRVRAVEEQARRELETVELRERIAQQWAEVRATRRSMDAEPRITGGVSNFSRAKVPYGVDLAAAWGWRFLVICAAGAIILYLLQFFMVMVLPLVIALLLAALFSPVVHRLGRLGVPRKLGALLVVLLLVGIVALSATFVGNQVAQGVSDLSTQVGSGVGQIRAWLRDGPLQVTDSQISTALGEAQAQLTSLGDNAVETLSELGTTLGHVVAGIFIVLFATYFFLADGGLIWAWLVRLFPRAGRLQADSSGRVAWASLTQFVRATVLVAAVDAIGIAVGAAVLGVPFVGAIGVLVFLGSFVPMIGAAISGTVAVLVALVAQGPVTALIMLGVVVAVQQVEAHVLQPFLMGRFVSVHPLGVIVAIAMGVLVAGIAGALIAVPLAASLNAVVQHLARHTDVGQDADEATDDDPIPVAGTPAPDADGPEPAPEGSPA
ncbi:Predicted PurR-regulated permease PerM [Nocardioides scoriae]|uniref:Predicted PurR-regulated permease PerM n=1 Tax=Nocardioides scoriae TaxID=642780 RepID=A0A1H1SSV1_9ACTN|nr:AI-2E family transporter [Nocardioides scoriae]SDS51062.1 Predicted PurR-regulated permease PerM [Nocardioides scoriae]